MEGFQRFTEAPAASVILASFERPEFPQRRRAKKKRPSGAKGEGNRVLIVGRQPELALYRAEFLRQAGFTVLVAQDVDQAIPIMQRGSFDALVLSYTLPSKDVEYLADAARDYHSECAIVAISNSSTVDMRIEPDATALADQGPTGLLSALKEVLRGN